MTGQAAKSDLRQRFETAEADATKWRPKLREAYDLMLPAHLNGFSDDKSPPSTAQIFDATASIAVGNRAGDLHDKLFPPFEEWVDFEEADGLDADAITQKRETFHTAVERSNFHTEIQTSLEECVVSVGCITVHRGSMRRPLRFEAVPAGQLIIEEGPDGDLATTWRIFNIPIREIEKRWPGAKLTDDLQQRLAKNGNEKIELIEGEIYNADSQDWEIRVEVKNAPDEAALYSKRRRVRRRIAFRMGKAHGSAWGWGPGLRVLPDAKTCNKVQELILKNASIAVTGIWQADDDGVLNPANVKLVPGAIIPKAIGSSGLTPLKAPGQFDVSQFVLADLRQKIETAIAGPLPPEAARTSRRSATEVETDERRHARIDQPKTLLVMSEIHEPIVLAILDVLAEEALAGTKYHIPQAGDEQLWPISSMVRLRNQAKAEAALRSYANAMAIDQEETPNAVKRGKFIRWYLEWGGMPTEVIEPEPEQQPAPNPLQEAIAGAAGPAAVAAGKEIGKAAGAQIAEGGLNV